MIWPFQRSLDQSDFSKYISETSGTNKQRLIAECQKYSVSIFIADATESTSGIYAQLRAVASEAELEQRLSARKAISKAKHANIIATLAFMVSVATFIKSIWWP